MKTTTAITLTAAAFLLAASIILTSNNVQPAGNPETFLPAKKLREAPSAATPTTSTENPEITETPSEETDDSVNLAAWTNRFAALAEETGSRNAAIELLKAEMDSIYHQWVAGEIATLSKLPPADRYDRLAEIEGELAEGAAAILELAGIDGSRHATLLARAMEAVSAEIQYAESNTDHQGRIALLRLDLERQSRLEGALQITDSNGQQLALAEIDRWHDSGLGEIYQPETAEESRQ